MNYKNDVIIKLKYINLMMVIDNLRVKCRIDVDINEKKFNGVKTF